MCRYVSFGGQMRGGLGGILIFCFGLAAGVLIAFAGAGFLEDSAWAVISVFVGLLMLLAVLAAGIFAARKPLWKRLFGYAEAQMEMVAEPLARVAERAIDRDPTGATQAARDVVAVVLARYSWVTTRRWLLASLTALIAAMAALAGTALLFKQNLLLEAQSSLLREQNEKIGEQTVLLVQSVELAEAARNATLAVEITEIAQALGEAAVRAEADGPAGEGLTDGSNYVNVLDV
jgi:MFS family permease